MKRFIGLVLFLFVCNIKASSNYFFIWENDYINVALGSDIDEYAEKPIANLYDVYSRINDADLTYTRGANGTTLSIVDTNHLGEYRVSYEAYASNYNYEASHDIIFNVVDITPPTLITTEPITITVGTNLNQLYDVSYYDNYDQEINLYIDLSNINLEKLGNYKAFYKLTDQSGNEKTVLRDVLIVDDLPPDFYFSNSVYNVSCEFNQLNDILILDNYDGNITSSVEIISSNVNSNEIGDYYIVYKIVDDSGNSSIIRRDILIRDLEKPEIVLYENEINLLYQNEFDLFGNIKTVFDNYDNVSIEDVVIKNTYNANKEGRYKIEYILEDAYHNQKIEYLIVNVYDNVSPYFEVSNTIINQNQIFDPFAYIKAYDNISGEITEMINLISITKDMEGYLVLYEVMDLSGNYERLSQKYYYSMTNHNQTITIPDYPIIEENTEQIETIVNNNEFNYIYFYMGVGIIFVITIGVVIFKHKKK